MVLIRFFPFLHAHTQVTHRVFSRNPERFVSDRTWLSPRPPLDSSSYVVIFFFRLYICRSIHLAAQRFNMDTAVTAGGTTPASGSSAETAAVSQQHLRIATIGNVDAGKSTLVGCLTRNVADDGRGKARSLVFAHKHEKETGRSSVRTYST